MLRLRLCTVYVVFRSLKNARTGMCSLTLTATTRLYSTSKAFVSAAMQLASQHDFVSRFVCAAKGESKINTNLLPGGYLVVRQAIACHRLAALYSSVRLTETWRRQQRSPVTQLRSNTFKQGKRGDLICQQQPIQIASLAVSVSVHSMIGHATQ